MLPDCSENSTAYLRLARRHPHSYLVPLTCTIVEEVLRALYLANTGSSIWEEMKREDRRGK